LAALGEELQMMQLCPHSKKDGKELSLVINRFDRETIACAIIGKVYGLGRNAGASVRVNAMSVQSLDTPLLNPQIISSGAWKNAVDICEQYQQ